MGHGHRLRHRDHRRRHHRPRHRAGSGRALAGRAARRAREGSRPRHAPDREQLGRHPLRDLLQARLLQGQALRRGQGPDARLLPEARDPRRPRRQGDRRDQPGRATAAPDALRARSRQRRAGRDDRPGTAQGDRAARQRAPRDPVPLDRDRRLQRGGRGHDARADRARRRDRDERPRDVDRAHRRRDRHLHTAHRRPGPTTRAPASTRTSSRGWRAPGSTCASSRSVANTT